MSHAGANITVGGETKDSISGDGTFHANGYVGGGVTLTAGRRRPGCRRGPSYSTLAMASLM